MRNEKKQLLNLAWNKLSDNAGFSLVELLVAVAVFSIAALTLLESQTGSLRASSHVQSTALATIVAENKTAQFLGSVVSPTVGSETGNQSQFGMEFQWAVSRTLVPGAGIMRHTVTVRDADGNQLALLTAFRLME